MGSARQETTPSCPKSAELAQRHAELMVKVAHSQDWAAFQELFLFFGPRVKAMMMKAGADNALAEDLVQETMTKVWRKAGLYAAGRGTVSTWIFTVARNTRIDRIRRASSQAYEDIDDLDLESDEPTGEDYAHLSQQAKSVAEALQELPIEQRQVIELAFIHDLSQSEIAERLSLPLGTVKSRLRLAYGKLKVKLEDYK